MKKLVLAAVLAFSLGGCATLQRGYDAFTGVTISPTAVIVAGNAYDALELSAANYLNFCKVNRAVIACTGYVQARKAIIPAILSGRTARNNMEAFLKTHPGQLGPRGLYDALSTSVSTIQSIVDRYNMAGVGK